MSQTPVRLLTIETTCDETAAAVVTDRLEVLSSVVASQETLHEAYQGVVPEIAARAHMERMLPVLEKTLSQAGIGWNQIDAIAVAHTPGLIGSLLVGLTAAKTIALVLGKPLIGINHLHAHIYACRMAAGFDVFPCVGLVVSGGHTHLYDCRSATDFELLGGTIDDAAGEAFDKVAAMLGLPFPGGPAISKLAAEGDASAYRFPRAFLRDRERIAFSFSGLKTAVRYAITGPGNKDVHAVTLSRQEMADLAASFQEAVVDCLVAKAALALEKTERKRLCVGGGVAANPLLRKRLEEMAEEASIDLHIAPPQWCTDNAVMGAIAVEHYRAGEFSPLSLDVISGLVRSNREP